MLMHYAGPNHTQVPMGEDHANDAIEYHSSTADALIKTGPGVYYGAIVNVALSAATVVIRDAVAAGAGTIIDTIPASSAIGAQRNFNGKGIKFTTGLYIDYGGTGTVVTLYR